MPARPLLLGHRGARQHAPENTIAAFDLALEHGAHGFEFDVRATRDRQAIICHDPTFARLVLRRNTLKQLQAAAVSAKAQLPTLDDVLARYSRSAFLNMEVKVRGMEADVLRALRRHRPKRGYLVSSFLPSVVRKLHRLDRSLPLGIICRSRWQLRRWKKLPVSFVVPHYSLLSEKLVERIHAGGKKVATWTVNDPRLMLRVAQLGVDAVISDNTKLLMRTLGPS